ncbi:MAG: PhnD/SsuA/transferrin family substrate-binding protein [Defluviitaleaceae bacterium]|nr:PhnD/SsuA/transferrin family substrate-binding protein [Defluviitaleaceae bacterium]
MKFSGFILICFAIALFATGCAGQNTAPAATAQTHPPVQPVATEPTTPVATPEPVEEEPELPRTQINIAVGEGSGGMAFAGLMYDNYRGLTQNDYNFQVTSGQVIQAGLLSGELDMGAMAINIAATMYNATGGEIRVLTLNAHAANFILDRSQGIQSIEDLRGRTIHSGGQGSTQEFAFAHILRLNGMDINTDVEMVWGSNHNHVANLLLAEQVDLVLLPQPFVTSVMQEDPSIYIVLDLTEEWENVMDGAPMPSSSTVVRTEFLEENREAVEIFLLEQAAGVDFVVNNHARAAELMEKFGITQASIAIDSLPNQRLSAMNGLELRAAATDFLMVMYDANPDSVGGSIPDDDFWFIPR